MSRISLRMACLGSAVAAALLLLAAPAIAGPPSVAVPESARADAINCAEKLNVATGMLALQVATQRVLNPISQMETDALASDSWARVALTATSDEKKGDIGMVNSGIFPKKSEAIELQAVTNGNARTTGAGTYASDEAVHAVAIAMTMTQKFKPNGGDIDSHIVDWPANGDGGSMI